MSHPLNDVVWCKLAPSPIHGVGVFAIRDIPAGTQLSGGYKMYAHKGKSFILPEIMDLMLDHYCNLDEMWALPNPNHDVELQCFMNHSEDANSDGHVALRDIKKGEEVTENYKKLATPLSKDAREHYKDFI